MPHKLLEIWIYISEITQNQPNVHMLEREGTTQHLKTGEHFSFINSLHFLDPVADNPLSLY